MKTNKQSILIVSYFYAPIVNPRAIRWTAVAEQWVRNGFDVFVVSSWFPGLARRESINGVRILRTGGGITESIRAKLTGGNQQRKSSSVGTRSNPIGRIARFIHDVSWKKLYWPDSSCLWTRSAIHESSRLMMRINMSSFITVSDPYTSHLAGLALNRRFPDVRWLVDIGDPFSFEESTPPNNRRIYKKLNHFLESKIFAKASNITVTNSMTKDKYAMLFPDSSDKISVIYPLVSLSRQEAGQAYLEPDTSSVTPQPGMTEFRAAYFGTLYKKIRNPAFLLKVFRTFVDEHSDVKLDLHFFGAVNDCEQCFEPYADLQKQGRLVIHGKVDRDEVFSEMQEAGILINIGNDSPYQLPSKIVEYASLGKPILNIAGIPNDSSAEFLRDYPALLSIFDDGKEPLTKNADDMKDFISRCHELDTREIAKEFSRLFSVESITNQYTDLLLHQGIYWSDSLGA